MGEIRDALAEAERTYGVPGDGRPATERFTRLLSTVRSQARREEARRQPGVGSAGWPSERSSLVELVAAIGDTVRGLYPGKLLNEDVKGYGRAVQDMGVELADARERLRLADGRPLTFSADGNGLVAWAEQEWSVTPADGEGLRTRLAAVFAEIVARTERRLADGAPLPIEGQGPVVHHLTTRMAGAVSELRKVVPDGLAETVPPLATPAEIPNYLDAAVREIVARHDDVEERAGRARRQAERYRSRLDELYNRLERDVAADYLRAGLGLGSLTETVAYLIACGPVALKGAAVVYPPTPNIDGSPVGGFRPTHGGTMVEVCGHEGPDLGGGPLRCLRSPGHAGNGHTALTEDGDEMSRIEWQSARLAPAPGSEVEVDEQFAALGPGTVLMFKRSGPARTEHPLLSGAARRVLVADHPRGSGGFFSPDGNNGRWTLDGVMIVQSDGDLLAACEHGVFTILSVGGGGRTGGDDR